jgi:hypothetical protein
MRLKFTLISIILCLLNMQNAYAQLKKEVVLGKWHLIEMSLDSVVQFNQDKPEIISNIRLARLKSDNPYYTKEDSIRTVTKALEQHEAMKKYSIEFNNDSTFYTTGLSGGGKRITGKVDTNYYYIDENKYQIVEFNPRTRKPKIVMDTHVSGNVLTFSFSDKRNHYTFIWRREE